MPAVFAADLSQRGHRTSLLVRYWEDGMLQEAARRHRATALLREKTFGPSHASTLRVKSLLVDVLLWNQSYLEALPIALENVENSSVEIGLRDWLALRAQVAILYERLYRRDESEAILRENLQFYQDSPDTKDHPSRLFQQTLLAETLLNNGSSEEALELALTTEKEAVLTLGPHHATSISAKRAAVEALDLEGQLETAVWVHESLLSTVEKSRRPDHLLTIEQLAILGVQYYRLGRLDAAKQLYERVMELVAKDVNNAIPAVGAMVQYATILQRRGLTEESVTILENLRPRAEEHLGSEHQVVVSVLAGLSAAYHKQKRWTEAEALGRAALNGLRSTVGDMHSQTLAAFSNLATTLACQRRWAESAAVAKEHLGVLAGIGGAAQDVVNQPDLLFTIGRGLTLSQAFEEAAVYWDRLFGIQELGVSEPGRGSESGGSLRAPVLAAVCHANLGHRPATRRCMRWIHARISQPWKDAPATVVHHLTELAKACDRQGWVAETEHALAAGKSVAGSATDLILESVVSRLEDAAAQFAQKTGIKELRFDMEAGDDGGLMSTGSGTILAEEGGGVTGTSRGGLESGLACASS